MDKAREIVTIQAVGRASAGFLSNPTNGVLILAGIMGILGGIVGKDAIELFTNYFGSIGTLLDPNTERQAKVEAAHDAGLQLKAIIDFLSLFPGVPL